MTPDEIALEIRALYRISSAIQEVSLESLQRITSWLHDFTRDIALEVERRRQILDGVEDQTVIVAIVPDEREALQQIAAGIAAMPPDRRDLLMAWLSEFDSQNRALAARTIAEASRPS